MKELENRQPECATFNSCTEIQAGDFVRWNGSPDVMHGISFPDLSTAKIYRVIYVDVHSWHTNLILQDIESGEVFEDGFNSALFERVKVVNAVSTYIPFIGERYQICILTVTNGRLVTMPAKTSRITERHSLGDAQTWLVVTLNSVYKVMVIPEES
jgi:hypothetical protein